MARIHPRSSIVREAELRISQAIQEAVKDLTDAETLQAVNGVCSSFIAGMAKYAIRAERHPENPDNPGDLE